MMYGYETDETEERIPLPLAIAHKIAKEYARLRKFKYFHLLKPDGKCQVSVFYAMKKRCMMLMVEE